ncbi:MAG: DUF3413 domain-containing protein [Bacteriovoracaceae bacterium]
MKSQRRIALVWGRKFFFSYGLLSLLGVGLLFFQHLGKPESVLAWIYLITSFLGHFGMMIVLGFFVLYTPLVWISPGYYWSRFWASSIITTLVAVMGFDAVIVAQYRWHFYELLTLNRHLSFDDILLATGLNTIFFGSIIVFWIFLFVIGEKLWRHLQRRFSQTVSNWYLYPIIGCFLISNLLHLVADYRGNQELAVYDDTFTFQASPTAKKVLTKLGLQKGTIESDEIPHHPFFYPKGQLKCDLNPTKNLFVILVPAWTTSQFTDSENEVLSHYASHGQVFEENYLGTNNPQEGLFSFFYGLPTFYMQGFTQTKTPAVFLEKLEESGMDSSILAIGAGAEFLSTSTKYKKIGSNQELVQVAKNKLSSLVPGSRFAIFSILDNSVYSNTEVIVKELMEELVSKKLVKETHIIVASISSPDAKAPLFTLFSNREDQVVTHFSQMIDVVPSLMKDYFKCKNSYSDFSLGNNIWEEKDKNIMFNGFKNNLSILSFDESKKALVELEKQDYLKELKTLTFFYKRSR